MRIAFLNTYVARGGAARAAFRIFSGIFGHPGIEARFFTRENGIEHPGVHVDRSRLTIKFGEAASAYDQKSLKRKYPERMLTPFSVNRIADTVHETINAFKPDLVHLHWPHAGFLRLESLAEFKVPIVWTIHDMWAFTGVCHYTGKCRKYMSGCGACPLLKSNAVDDISARTFSRKRKIYHRLDLHIVSPSKWLARSARASPLLRNKPISVIPNCIDAEIFQPLNKKKARKNLGLPLHRLLILFGADFALDDRRKGGHLLMEALKKDGSIDGDLIIFGCDKPKDNVLSGHTVYWIGNLYNDQALINAYSAADVFVLPSMQDNLPNTMLESLSCGTPVLAFNVGGIPDMIRHGINGFLLGTGNQSPSALGRQLNDALKSGSLLSSMRKSARKTILTEYNLDTVSQHYIELYQDCLK